MRRMVLGLSAIFVTHIAFRAGAVPLGSVAGALLVAGILVSTWFVPDLRSALLAGGPWLVLLDWVSGTLRGAKSRAVVPACERET